MKMMNVLVIDAQGGGLGKQLITSMRKEIEGLHITAVGSNSLAASAMLKAGADEAATGENAVVVCCKKADIIIGPIGIVIADAMLGEITAKMAAAVAQSQAARILIPFSNCDNYIAGVSDFGTSRLIADALSQLKKMAAQKQS